MDLEDKLKRVMQQSGLLDSGESTTSDIGDYSASSEDEWTPNNRNAFKNNLSANLNNEQPSSPVDSLPPDSLQLPPFSGITPKRMKQNETVNSDNIGDYSTSSEVEWTPDDSRRKSSITILADVHLPAISNSFQLLQCARAFNKPSTPVDTLPPIHSTQVPSFPGITPKLKKLNETNGLFESESNSEQDEENVKLNPESGLFEAVETETDLFEAVETETDLFEALETEPDLFEARETETDTFEAVETDQRGTCLTQIGKKRISRQEQWEKNKKIKSNLKKHTLKDLPNCRCKCKDKLSKKQVETVFNKFINLESHTEQNIYLQGCLQEVNPKRFRPRSMGSETTPRARRVFEYNINLPKKTVNVCQKAFLAIHGILRDRLVCKVQHQEKDISDGRGRQSNPKIDVESVTKVHKFIESLPARQSHYSRTSSKHRKFLDSHLSIAELHRKFSIDHPECIVPYEKFRCIFNQDFNISFGQPRKDICTTCEKFKVDITCAELAKDRNKAKQLKSAHELHLRKAEVFLKTLSKVEKEKPSNSLSLCFDFQKNLPLPVTNITDEYYLRQLWMHNFGVHNLCQNTAAMFLFTENYAHKGPNEVITALEYYINKEKTPSQQQLDLYCDNCYSQNKNRYIFTFLDQLCAKGVFEKITVQYPIPGHSMMPIDRDFALIERKRKKHDKIYTPEYYVQLIKNSKNTNKFEIVFLEKSLMKESGSNDVLKVKDYKKLYDTRIKANLPGISKCRRATFKRRGKPEFAESMKGEDFKPFSLYKVGFSRIINETPDDCYNAPLTIKTAKSQDIKRLLESVPEAERYFYGDLFKETRDPLTPEFNSEDEVE